MACTSSLSQGEMTEEVTVKVLYFAGLKELTNLAAEKVKVPKDLQIKQFLPFLMQKQSALASQRGKALLATCACAIDLEYVNLDHDEDVFKNGSEVALIPPVSGG